MAGGGEHRLVVRTDDLQPDREPVDEPQGTEIAGAPIVLPGEVSRVSTSSTGHSRLWTTTVPAPMAGAGTVALISTS